MSCQTKSSRQSKSQITKIESPYLKSIPGLIHGFFGCTGGVSREQHESLNFSINVDDSMQAVEENRRRLLDNLNCQNMKILQLKEVHSNKAIFINKSDPNNDCIINKIEADGMVCGCENKLLAITTADCGPVLLVDEESKIIAACHAGWKGAVKGIIKSTVKVMVKASASRNRIIAVIGPLIEQSSYNIGDDLKNMICEQDLSSKELFVKTKADKYGGSWLFDLPQFIVNKLKSENITRIDRIKINTRTNENFFSARRQNHVYGSSVRGGRQFSVIGWKKVET